MFGSCQGTVCDGLWVFQSRETAYLTYFAVSWLLVWGTYWSMRRLRPTLAERSWVQLLGATLMLWPFVRYTNLVWEQWAFVVDTTSVARTVPASQWWESISRRWWMYVLVPGFGLYLFRRPRGSHWVAPSHIDRVLRGTGLTGLGRSPLRVLVDSCSLFLAVVAGYMLYDVATEPFRAALQTGDESRVFNALDPWLGFVLAVTAGVTEEFLFRGVLQRRLTLIMPLWVAVIVQAIGFGLIHSGYGTIDHMLGPAVFGVAAGFIAARWGLVPAIMVHFLIDLFAFWGTAARLGHGWTEAWLAVLFIGLVAVPTFYWLHRAYRWYQGQLATPRTTALAGTAAVLVEEDGDGRQPDAFPVPAEGDEAAR